ncbi:hypothetical protein H8959_015038 [Pygathrix nigripes]
MGTGWYGGGKDILAGDQKALWQLCIQDILKVLVSNLNDSNGVVLPHWASGRKRKETMELHRAQTEQLEENPRIWPATCNIPCSVLESWSRLPLLSPCSSRKRTGGSLGLSQLPWVGWGHCGERALDAELGGHTAARGLDGEDKKFRSGEPRPFHTVPLKRARVRTRALCSWSSK